MFGFLNCNKPVGITSRDLVNIVQRRIRPTKVGHCGTLDPLAEGVMVIGVGPAVRLTTYMQQQAKRYIGDFRLGASSDTGDMEKGCDEHPDLPKPSADQIETVRANLIGEITQVPPAYSAIKIDGRRAYERVRAGEQVDMPSRKVRIDSIRVLAYDFPNIQLDITCGAGTYIRTLGMDLADAAGTKAVMTKLVRQAVGACELEQAIDVDELKECSLEDRLLPPTIALSDMTQVSVNRAESERLGNGLCIHREIDADPTTEIAAIDDQGQLRALLRRKDRGWCPKRVFNV